MFNIIHEHNIYKYLYSGNWINSINRNTLELKALDSNKFLGSIQSLTKEEVINSINNSKDASVICSTLSSEQKKHLIGLCADLILTHKEYLSQITFKETGKEFKYCEKEIIKTYNLLNHLLGNWTYIVDKKELNFIDIKPRGIILSMNSSDSPIYSTTLKLAAAIISGNSVILIPPIRGTISALHIAEIFNSGISVKGAINTITGISKELYDFTLINKNINFIDFTGDADTGRHIAAVTSNIPMNIELEKDLTEISDILTPEEITEIVETISNMMVKK